MKPSSSLRDGRPLIALAGSVLALVAIACSTSESTSPGGGSGGGGGCPCDVGNSGIHFTIGCGQSQCVELNGQATGYRCDANGATEDPSVCTSGSSSGGSGSGGSTSGGSSSGGSGSGGSSSGGTGDAAATCTTCEGGQFCGLANKCETPASTVLVVGNYQGGTFEIDVDQHMPNLGIGLVSYDPMTVTIGGAYAADVVAVLHAGYDPGTTVKGAPSAVFADEHLPRVSADAGPTDVIVDDGTSAPGGPTEAQIEQYFEASLGGGTLAFHTCQYAAYSGTILVSKGGSCP